MLVRQSQLFGKARRQAPSDAQVISHRLLTRAGYIDQLASGIFSLLPLGWRVQRRLEDIIRQQMHQLGASEMLMPALQPAALWQLSGRLTTMEPPLFRLTDQHDKELVLASTHEEVITDLAGRFIESYKDLPLAVYQIQTKFRNEIRSTGGLLRVREFQMKDLYSFHRSQDELTEYYEQVRGAYLRIFAACDLIVHTVAAASGSIGGSVSHEFSIEAESGEDKVRVCPECDFATNVTAQAATDQACPNCSAQLQVKSCIENGHIFQLGTKYSQALGALFTDQDGSRQPVVMGCYGIGIGRLAAAIVETHHDDRGIRWPAAVAPFDAHVIAVQPSVNDAAAAVANQLAQTHEILFDDRSLSAGEKFAESDLIGIPWRLVISEKTQALGKVEIVSRLDGTSQLVQPGQLAAVLASAT